jgi:hypothetical protein
MAITALSGFDDVATDYVVVAATDGKMEKQTPT